MSPRIKQPSTMNKTKSFRGGDFDREMREVAKERGVTDFYEVLRDHAEKCPGTIEYLCGRMMGEIRGRSWQRAGVRTPPYSHRRHKELFGGWFHPPGDDHGVLLIDPNGVLGYLSEPYNVNMRDVIEFCDRHNVDCVVFPPYGSWFPGFTIALMYTKRGEHFRLSTHDSRVAHRRMDSQP